MSNNTIQLEEKDKALIVKEAKKWYKKTKYKKIKKLFSDKNEFILYMIEQTKYHFLGQNVIEWISNKQLTDIPVYGEVIKYKYSNNDLLLTKLTEKDIDNMFDNGATINDILKYWNNDFLSVFVLINLWFRDQISFEVLFDNEYWI